MSMSNRITEDATVVAQTLSNAGTAGIFLSDAVSLDCDTGRRFLAIIQLGVIGSSGTVAAVLQWSATSSGTYANITGTAIVTDTAGSKTHLIEASVEQIKQFAPTAAFMKLSVTTAVAATPFGAVILGFDGAHKPITAGTDVGQVIVFV